MKRRSDVVWALEGFLISLDATTSPMQYPDKAEAILTYIEDVIGMVPVDEWELEEKEYTENEEN